jgi:toxin ParE1/3/4
MIGLFVLTPRAKADLKNIQNYTLKHYSQKQLEMYVSALQRCTEDMAISKGYFRILADIHPDLRVKHCQYHYIFGLMRNSNPMVVIGIMHEKMDYIARIQKRLK